MEHGPKYKTSQPPQETQKTNIFRKKKMESGVVVHTLISPLRDKGK